MGINFPSSPANGQIFNASPGVSFVANGGVWRPAPLKTALPKNYIVNPVMQVSQETGGVSLGNNGNFAADMWACYFSGWPSVSSARVASTVQTLFYPYYLSFGAPLRASLGAGDYVMWIQQLEGQRVVDLQWGTVNAKQIVIRFTCNCAPAGTYALAIRNLASTRSYIVPFAAGPGEQEFIVVIPGCTDGVWASDNTSCLTLSFCPASGVTYLTTANAWQTGNYLGYTGMPNIAVAGTGTFNIGRVGLYLDPYKTGVAPPFEIPVETDEIRRCQRYWYKAFGARGLVVSAAVLNALNNIHPVPMRAKPAASLFSSQVIGYDASTTPAITSISANPSNSWALELNTGTAGLIAARPGGHIWGGSGTVANNCFAMNARL